MINHFLFTLIILSYLSLINIVSKNYKNNTSLSNILCDEKCCFKIIKFFFIMCIFIILYEINRSDIFSLVIIILLICNIYGIIKIDETYLLHYVLTFFIFVLILLFTYYHNNLFNSLILKYLFYTQCIIGFSNIILLYNINVFLINETLYLLNFAIFYIVLHFINN